MLWFTWLACVDDRVLHTVPVEVAPSPAVLAADVPVTLTTARFDLGDLRLEGPASPTTARWPALPLLGSTAMAHPGHDFAGGVGGELLGSWTIDLLEGAQLGEASVYSGRFASARVGLFGTVTLRGTATVDGLDRSFDFELDVDTEVTGIPFEHDVTTDSAPTRLTLAIDLAHALSFVDWTTASTGTLTTDDGQLANTVTFGVVATPSFTLSLE